MSCCIVVGIHCHNIPNCTYLSGHHGLIEVIKNNDIAKMSTNYINYNSAHPTLLHKNHMESRPQDTFWLEVEVRLANRLEKVGGVCDIFAHIEVRQNSIQPPLRSVLDTSIFELPLVENWTGVLCTSACTHACHYCR